MTDQLGNPDRHTDNRPEWMKQLPTWYEIIEYAKQTNEQFSIKEPTQAEIAQTSGMLSHYSSHIERSLVYIQTPHAYSYNEAGGVVCEEIDGSFRMLGFSIDVNDQNNYTIFLCLEKSTVSQDSSLSYNFVQYKYAINVDDIDPNYTCAHTELPRLYDEDIVNEKIFTPDQVIDSIYRIISAVRTNQPLTASRILSIIENEELWQLGKSRETGEVWIDDLRCSKVSIVANIGFRVLDHSISDLNQQAIMPFRNVSFEGYFSGITPFDIAPKNWLALSLGPKLGDSTTLPCAVFEASEVEANDLTIETVEPSFVYIPLRPENIFDINPSFSEE